MQLACANGHRNSLAGKNHNYELGHLLADLEGGTGCLLERGEEVVRVTRVRRRDARRLGVLDGDAEGREARAQVADVALHVGNVAVAVKRDDGPVTERAVGVADELGWLEYRN